MNHELLLDIDVFRFREDGRAVRAQIVDAQGKGRFVGIQTYDSAHNSLVGILIGKVEKYIRRLPLDHGDGSLGDGPSHGRV